ncbi:MAG TPA: OmpH family outer membrane protein [Verrucomicrobiae bacterium]|nr:OmpH family outer membrane protein [Verrucomicrobiae bacterium]
MKNCLRMILPAALLMTFLCASASAAEAKIATVDLKKLFDNFYKTKLATDAIKKRAAELDKDDQDYKDKFQQAKDDYEKLRSQANDQALSDEERTKRKQEADAKLKQLQQSQTIIEQFERQAQSTLNDQRMQARQKVLAEIQAAVAAKAKAGGYTLVIDTAAESISPSPVVLYSNGQDDLTDAVLAQLNIGAPIDMPATTTATPSSSLMNTPAGTTTK